MASQQTRDAEIYAEMQIAAILTVAAMLSQQPDQVVIDRYKTLLRVLREKGTQ